jgi:cobalt-zinc-cadmium efflux system membrane fusion protein
MNAKLPVVIALLFASCAKQEQSAAPAKAPASEAASPSVSPSASPTRPRIVALGPAAPELREMSVETVQLAPVPAEDTSAPARIEANPNRIGRARLPVPGRIVSVMVQLGDSVKAGQPLAIIDSPSVTEAETGYLQAESIVKQAEVALAKANADLERITDLFENKAVAQKEVLAAKTVQALSVTALEQAVQSRRQAQQKLEFLGLKTGRNQQQVVVASPLAGKVLEVAGVPGEFRNEVNEPLVTVADLSRIWATADVPETQIRQYRLGGQTSLELLAYPGEFLPGHVTRIADTADAETRTVKVSAELENLSGRLRPMMFGRMRYVNGLVRVPWVPEAAIVRIGDQDYVFVEESKGHFRLTVVVLGKRHESGFAVLQGVSAGDRVVTRGAVYLKGAL